MRIAEWIETEVSEITNIFDSQREHFISSGALHPEDRIAKLKKLEKWIKDNRAEIQKAAYADFKKPAEEMDLTEIYAVLADINFNLKHIKSWVKTQKVNTPMTLLGTSSYIHYEPKGVCLIIAPWNYPFQLVIGPLVSAITAGNHAILKPSEMTPHVAALVQRLCEELFDPREIACVQGGITVSKALLDLPFDHIFFTGSPAVGKIVMAAAAKNLTSVTLELGGKSPTIIDESANLKDAAEKIAFGKFVNNGQTCIAPDYILVHESKEKEFIEQMRHSIQKMYDPESKGIAASEGYARIVNEKHYFRILELIQDALDRGAEGLTDPENDVSQRFIAPTLLRNVPEDAQIWEEEIFGPVLPIKTYRDLDDAIGYINARPKPLALYIFSTRNHIEQKILEKTSAGGVCINDCLIHFMNHELPFGGVNNSGIGKSHGYFGFLEFSNAKAVLKQRVGPTALKPLYPPYTSFSKKMIDLLLKYF